MKRPMLIMLVGVAVFFGAVFGWKAFVGMQMQQAMQSAPLPLVTVSTAQAELANWAPSFNAVGTLRAAQSVAVTAQLEGQITSLHFDSGDNVAGGELLVQQYADDDEARLQGLLANLKLAKLTFKRLQELDKQKLTSEFDLDMARADLERTEAAVAALRLEIAKKSIRAPFAGRLGIRKVDIGQYIEPGDTLVSLEAVDQLFVDFPVTQRRIGELHTGQNIRLYVDAWPEQYFTGTIDAIEPRVELETRSVRVRGLVNNDAGKLVPGMFARIEILLPVQTQVVTVPQAAIVYSPYGNSVYALQAQPGDEAAFSVVKTLVVLGATRGDQVAIEAGLSAGATVVTAGQQKLRNGARVSVDNTVPVSNNPAPQPDNN